MIRNMTRGIPRLFKDGYKQFSGVEEAVLRNCDAAVELSEVVRTSFGPNGLSKIVINRIEKVFVTTDAATIINELDVQHPAAKVLCLAAAMQQREIGDGANFVVIFGGELLRQAQNLLRSGLHPSDLIRGYTMAERKAQEYLKELTIYEVQKADLTDKEKLVIGIKSAISSKQYGLEGFLSDLVAQACLNSMPPNPVNFNVDNVRSVKVLGGSIQDSHLVKGLVLETQPKSHTTFKEKTKVAVFTCSFESTQTETRGNILLHNAKELLDYTKGEEDFIHSIVKGLHDMGVGVVVIGEKITDIALHFLDKYHMVVLKLISKFALRRLCRATKARPCVTINNVAPDDLGFVNKVYTQEIGSEHVTIFSQVEIGESEVSTIIIRGATDTALQDVERAVDDGVNMVRAMTRNGRFVAGAGACEIEIARRLAKYAATVPGLEQYAIEKYAEALEVVPRTLAENTGLNDSDIIAKLYKAHEGVEDDKTNSDEDNEHLTSVELKEKEAEKEERNKKSKSNLKQNAANVGIDIVNGGVRDMTKEGVIDLMATRQMGIKLSSQAATTILRVDHIIMKKPAGGPRPQKRGHWDDNDDSW